MLGVWLRDDGKANKSSPLENSEASCGDNHKYIEEKLSNNVRLKELAHATIAKSCGEDTKIVIEHYVSASMNGSYAALSWLHKRLEESDPSRFVLHKPYRPMIGMSRHEVNGSFWGRPKDIVKRSTQRGTTETWFYAGNTYVHFNTEGLVESITEP